MAATAMEFHAGKLTWHLQGIHTKNGIQPLQLKNYLQMTNSDIQQTIPPLLNATFLS